MCLYVRALNMTSYCSKRPTAGRIYFEANAVAWYHAAMKRYLGTEYHHATQHQQAINCLSNKRMRSRKREKEASAEKVASTSRSGGKKGKTATADEEETPADARRVASGTQTLPKKKAAPARPVPRQHCRGSSSLVVLIPTILWYAGLILIALYARRPS